MKSWRAGFRIIDIIAIGGRCVSYVMTCKARARVNKQRKPGGQAASCLVAMRATRSAQQPQQGSTAPMELIDFSGFWTASYGAELRMRDANPYREPWH